jgi:RIO kinase 1
LSERRRTSLRRKVRPHHDRRDTTLNGTSDHRQAAVQHFVDEGLITGALRILKTGKEASVHLCRANPSTTGEDLLALKIYHPLDRRDFRDESLYRDGEWIKERRIRAALEKKTRFGRELQGSLWVSREWEMLQLLADAGVPVPRPLASTGEAILMTYVGDEADPAPQLRAYRPDPGEADDLFEQVVRAVELMLYRNVIHGDLSAYNVLVWEGRATVIDFPQAVDPRKNRHAHAMLERDLTRIAQHFERHGVHSAPARLAADLWNGWQFADLVPEELRVELEL